MAIPERMNKVSSRALAAEESRPWLFPDKNSRIKVIKRGRRPLQGTKLFVIMAISRSLGESIIRQPVIPAALQPNPIAMVRACFPQALQRWKGRSKL